MNRIQKKCIVGVLLILGCMPRSGYAVKCSEASGNCFLKQLPAEGPRVFTMDGMALAALKKRIQEEPASYREALNLLREEADAYLKAGPFTITKKTSLPPSGDKHDYESQGPYWWPNPKTKDGLPYIRRDGEVNPEIKNLKDHQYFSELMKAVKKLGLAWFLTGDEVYANRATVFLRTWFLDKETRMNPNLSFGQRIPGITDGRDIGIIETNRIGDIVDGIGLLLGSQAWSESDQEGMESWMRQYLDWLLHSDHGKGEASQHNNHGSWYDVQVAALALFTRQEDIARQTIIRARDERLPKHLSPDGSQPHELARTRSWSYSIMNLQSFFSLATLGEKVSIDLWHYSTEDGRSLSKALDFLVSFADTSGTKPWPYKQITEMKPDQLVPLLCQAACHFPTRKYDELARKLEGGEVNLNGVYYPCGE